TAVGGQAADPGLCTVGRREAGAARAVPGPHPVGWPAAGPGLGTCAHYGRRGAARPDAAAAGQPGPAASALERVRRAPRTADRLLGLLHAAAGPAAGVGRAGRPTAAAAAAGVADRPHPAAGPHQRADPAAVVAAPAEDRAAG